MTPSSDERFGSQASLTRSHTRLDEILTKPPKPSVAINGSTHSIKELIENTEPHKATTNGSAISVKGKHYFGSAEKASIFYRMVEKFL